MRPGKRVELYSGILLSSVGTCQMVRAGRANATGDQVRALEEKTQVEDAK